MGFAIFGIIVLFISVAISKAGPEFRKLIPFIKGARILGDILILLGGLFASIVQIDAGHIGVQKLFGKVKNRVLSSGLHLINPLVEIVEMDIRTMNYTMSSTRDEGNRAGDDAIITLSADGYVLPNSNSERFKDDKFMYY